MSIYSDVNQSFALYDEGLPKQLFNAWLKEKNKKPRKRKAISNGKRFNIFNRDNFRCTYCGRSSSEDGVKLEVDHIIPVAKGGKNTEENLTTACYQCNRGKNAKLLNAPLGNKTYTTTDFARLLKGGPNLTEFKDGVIYTSGYLSEAGTTIGNTLASGTNTLVLKADNENPLNFGS